MRWSDKDEQHSGQKKLDLQQFFSVLQLSFINYCRDQSPLPGAFLITLVLDENFISTSKWPRQSNKT